MSWLLAIAMWVGAAASEAALPKGATILDSDIVWDIWNPDSAAISPDGRHVVYISKGAIWKCEVTSGPSIKLAELPNTSTAFMAMPQFAYARTNFKRIRQTMGNALYNDTIARAEVRVHSLAWTPSQSGVVYGLSMPFDHDSDVVVHKVMYALKAGTVRQIAQVRRSKWAEPRGFTRFYATGDQKHLVGWVGAQPLIWNVDENRPQATCFDLLVPSTSRERFLGIEIDTRQFVLVGQDFNVIDRFDVFAPMAILCDLQWSPDERYAIFRRKHDHSSERWDGFRVELRTGKKRRLEGNFFTDEFQFTGRGGESLRMGIIGVWHDYSDNVRGGYLAIIPDGNGPVQTIAEFQRDPHHVLLKDMIERPKYPKPIANSNSSQFAMAFPRASDEAPGFEYSLLDRNGGKWLFPGLDHRRYIDPFYVVGFAADDRLIIAHDQTRLFSIPIAKIMDQEASDE